MNHRHKTREQTKHAEGNSLADPRKWNHRGEGNKHGINGFIPRRHSFIPPLDASTLRLPYYISERRCTLSQVCYMLENFIPGLYFTIYIRLYYILQLYYTLLHLNYIIHYYTRHYTYTFLYARPDISNKIMHY